MLSKRAMFLVCVAIPDSVEYVPVACMAKRIGVVLSGCGVYDGSEIHESVLILLALDRAGAESVCLAPDIAQRHVVSHVTNDESTGESRNVLSESARIARGRVRDLNNVTSAELDGVIFAGGFGAVKNLCDYAYKGPDCSVDPSVAKLLKDFHQVRKPIGAVCIAPVIIAKVLGASHPRLTIGTDKNTAKDIEKLGAVHVPCPVTDCVVDTKSKIVTTPAYMLASRITEAQAGIEKLVHAIVELA